MLAAKSAGNTYQVNLRGFGLNVRTAGGGHVKSRKKTVDTSSQKKQMVKVSCDKCGQWLCDAPRETETYCPYCQRWVKGGD